MGLAILITSQYRKNIFQDTENMILLVPVSTSFT